MDFPGVFTLTATAEVRDKDGNLISATPVELTAEMTAEQAAQIAASTDDQ